ncbi:TetR/AcrR family transcriptional regulator [Levilactobacillus sp. HBUAS70063]|uniref:TetR/AcrR family transcriptional regulator n=1 Tax=Levilactobacillus sp. HBUAS70063 TaxID=3109359 RepID=UPI0031335206
MKVKDEQKYDRLLQAAVHVLATVGLAGFSTTKVAKQAGIPQSNLYIYFKNKQALLLAVFRLAVHAESVAATASLKTEMAVIDQLTASIQGIYRFALDQPEFVTVIQLLLDDGQLKAKLSMKANDPANQQIQRLLRTGVERQILRSVDLNFHRYFLTRPVFHFAQGVRAGLYADTPAELATVTTMIMAAVLQPAVYQEWVRIK